jgi:hypothetical protein
MAIRDIIQTLKNKEGTLTNNKVCNFAYDDTAYTEDSASGVLNYNYNNHNNIPVKDNTVIKVNPTVTSKGFRSQVSTLPRMFLNHIFGRVSYNLNKTVDVLNGTLQAFYNAIGQANGLATLDNDGRLPYSQLPLSAVEYKGAWNAETNTPALSSGIGTFGDEYIVSVQGTRNLGEGSITYRVGDRVIYNGSIWQRIPSSSVRTVNTKSPDANGNVTVNAEDITTPDVYGYDKQTFGISWTQASGLTGYFDKVYFINGLWIAGNTNSNVGVWYSEDGKQWTISNITNNRLCDLINANGLFVAICGSSTLWSTDGKTWTEVSLTGEKAVFCVTFADNLFVAGGSDNGSSCIFLWSTDGKTWTEGSVTSFTNGSIHNIIFANGIWVAGVSTSSSYSSFYTSLDGKNWSPITLSIQNVTIKCLIYANNIFVAGSNRDLWYSYDGSNWTRTHKAGNDVDGICYAEGLFVATQGINSGGLIYSTDGVNWTNCLGTGLQGNFFREIKYAEGVWIATSYNHSYGDGSYGIWRSTDGKNWVNVTSLYQAYSVAFGNKTWVCAVASNKLVYSIPSKTNNVKTILDWLLAEVNMLA